MIREEEEKKPKEITLEYIKSLQGNDRSRAISMYSQWRDEQRKKERNNPTWNKEYRKQYMKNYKKTPKYLEYRRNYHKRYYQRNKKIIQLKKENQRQKTSFNLQLNYILMKLKGYSCGEHKMLIKYIENLLEEKEE